MVVSLPFLFMHTWNLLYVKFLQGLMYVSLLQTVMTEEMTRREDDDDSISERECHKGVKHLCETGIAKLPKKYILPEFDRPNLWKDGKPYSKFNDNDIHLLPVIDFSELQGSNRPHVLKFLANACEKYGFFQVCSKLN